MSVAVWITAFGIIVGATVTLSVAYLHRKQMRQIELHRADPSVPVTPPPHGITLFFKRNFWYWYCLVFGGFNLWALIRDLGKNTPVTRAVVFDISLDMIGVFFMALFTLLSAMLNRDARNAEVADKMLDVLVGMTHRIEKIEKSQNIS